MPDSQTIKTSAHVHLADQVTDAGKRIIGRKRHLGWDTLGLLLTVLVTATSVSGQKAGSRYSITATNVRHMGHSADTHQVQFLDALHRDHAEAEDSLRTNKAMGLADPSSQSRETNASRMLTANLFGDLDAWLRLLPLHDQACRPPRHHARRHLRIKRTAVPSPRESLAGHGGDVVPADGASPGGRGVLLSVQNMQIEKTYIDCNHGGYDW